MKSAISLMLFTFIIGVTIMSCDFNEGSNNYTAVNELKIPYMIAKNYFVKNNYKPSSLKNNLIQSQEELDAVFGMAATGIAEGLPSQIDFTNQFSIAFVSEPTVNNTSLSIKQVTKTDSIIAVQYYQIENEKTSFTRQPFLLIVVDKKYQGIVKFIKM